MLLDRPANLNQWKQQVLAGVPARPSRRQLLKAALASTGALAAAGRGGLSPALADTPSPAPRAVKTGTFFFPRLHFHIKDETGDQWNFNPVGDVILRRRLSELTNINASQEPVVVELADLEKMCRYPFVFATSEGYFDLPANEQKNLKEFLLRGGFVYADDCVYQSGGDRFFRDYIKMINRLFPDSPMKPVPNDHDIYHCYFDFPDGTPNIRDTRRDAHGLFEPGTGRLMTYVTPTDVHCGWCCMYFSKERNEAAIRMGINIIIYYLTH